MTAARLVTRDAGGMMLYDAEYDFQAVDGRLYWLAARDGTPGTADLRSVAVAGGPGPAHR